MFFLFSACSGKEESCSVSDFETFDLENLDSVQYSIFQKEFMEQLKPGITYKNKLRPDVSFANGKNFNLLSFKIDSTERFSPESLTIQLQEAKIRHNTCYGKYGYMGKIMKVKHDNKVVIHSPVLKWMPGKINSKILKPGFLYLEGIAKNLGIFTGKQEFIFIPYDDALLKKPTNYYIKLMIWKYDNQWQVHLFYAKSAFEFDPLNALQNAITLK
jgi:hypothetical protein